MPVHELPLDARCVPCRQDLEHDLPGGAPHVFASSTDERTLVHEASTAAVLVVDQAQIGEAVIAAASGGGCRAIVRCGIGFDNL